MNKFFVAFLIYFSILSSKASKLDIGILKILNLNQIVIQNAPYLRKIRTVYIYENKELKAIGLIQKCTESTCLVRLTKALPKRKITLEDRLYSEKTYAIKKEKIIKKREKPKKKPEIKTPNGLQLSYGGNFLASTQLVYWNTISKKSLFNFGLEVTNASREKVNLTGTSIIAGYSHEFNLGVYYRSYIGLNLLLSRLELEFTESDTEFTERVIALNSNLLFGISHQIKENFAFGIEVGVAYSTLEPTYKDINDIEFDSPYSSFNYISNLIVRYNF